MCNTEMKILRQEAGSRSVWATQQDFAWSQGIEEGTALGNFIIRKRKSDFKFLK